MGKLGAAVGAEFCRGAIGGTVGQRATQQSHQERDAAPSDEPLGSRTWHKGCPPSRQTQLPQHPEPITPPLSQLGHGVDGSPECHQLTQLLPMFSFVTPQYITTGQTREILASFDNPRTPDTCHATTRIGLLHKPRLSISRKPGYNRASPLWKRGATQARQEQQQTFMQAQQQQQQQQQLKQQESQRLVRELEKQIPAVTQAMKNAGASGGAVRDAMIQNQINELNRTAKHGVQVQIQKNSFWIFWFSSFPPHPSRHPPIPPSLHPSIQKTRPIILLLSHLPHRV